ncbi:MAG: hypothetical protein KAG18_05800 [Sinobacterium sp.]|nr:hypothetical protein [Sinobacterium sp.]
MSNGKLVIELSVEATEKYLAWASALIEAEVNADCVPSGVTISISIPAMSFYESEVYADTSEGIVEFGEASVNLVGL